MGPISWHVHPILNCTLAVCWARFRCFFGFIRGCFFCSGMWLDAMFCENRSLSIQPYNALDLNIKPDRPNSVPLSFSPSLPPSLPPCRRQRRLQTLDFHEHNRASAHGDVCLPFQFPTGYMEDFKVRGLSDNNLHTATVLS